MSCRLRIALVALFFSPAVLCGIPSGASELRLEPVRVESSAIIVDVLASGLQSAGSFDVVVRFDSQALSAPSRENGPLARNGMVLDHAADPGTYRLAVLVPAGVSGDGALARLRFPVREGRGHVELALDARVTDLLGSPLAVGARSARVELASVPTEEERTIPEASDSEDLTEIADESVPRNEDGSSRRDPEPDPDATEAAAAADAERDRPEDPEGTAASRFDRSRFDRDGRPRDPERRAEDLAARAAGFRLQLHFEPEARLADGAATPLRLRVRAWRSTEAIDLTPEIIRILGNSVEIERVEAVEGSLDAQLRVRGDALPAWLEVEAFGLLERHRVPVFPRVDVDLDGDGKADLGDYSRLVERIGARRGGDRYDERFDLVRDGVIDEIDVDAFRVNLVESERTRRLEALERASAVPADP